jgi:hypothetical protein
LAKKIHTGAHKAKTPLRMWAMFFFQYSHDYKRCVNNDMIMSWYRWCSWPWSLGHAMVLTAR